MPLYIKAPALSAKISFQALWHWCSLLHRGYSFCSPLLLLLKSPFSKCILFWVVAGLAIACLCTWQDNICSRAKQIYRCIKALTYQRSCWSECYFLAKMSMIQHPSLISGSHHHTCQTVKFFPTHKQKFFPKLFFHSSFFLNCCCVQSLLIRSFL